MNFSDRFLAKASGTTKNGASLGQVCETLRKVGVPIEERYPWTDDVDTWEEYYQPIPPKLFDNAKEDFLDKFSFRHEYVNADEHSIKEALKRSPLVFAVYAWAEKDGVNYKPKGAMENHAVVCYGWEQVGDEVHWKIFDSYDNFTKLYSDLPLIVKRFEIKKSTYGGKLSYKDILKKWFWFWYN